MNTPISDPDERAVDDSLYADRPLAPSPAPVSVQGLPPAPQRGADPLPRFERRMPALMTVAFGSLLVLVTIALLANTATGWEPTAALVGTGLAGFGGLLVLAAVLGLARRR